jgi:hypothetical protein
MNFFNPRKTSAPFMRVLLHKGYLEVDGTRNLSKARFNTLDERFKTMNPMPPGTVLVMCLGDLRKKETVQSVAAWFTDKKFADLILGELRQQLRHNGLKDLRDETRTQEDHNRFKGFLNFLKQAKPNREQI